MTGVRAARDQEDPVAGATLWRLWGRMLGWYLRLVIRTSRLEGTIPQDQVVLAFWHEFNFLATALAYALRTDHRILVFTTRGRRGMTINAMVESLGGAVVALPDDAARGSSASLVREVIAATRDGWTVAVSSDGPWGPRRVTKPGAVIIAREAGLPIVPLAAVARPAWRIDRRWDRLIVPLPFGRLAAVSGDRWTLQRADRLRPAVEQLQQALDVVAARAEAIAG